MQNTIELTSTAVEAMSSVGEVAGNVNQVSRYARTVAGCKELVAAHPVAAGAVAAVAVAGVSYLAYKGVSRLVSGPAKSENGE